MAAGIRDNSADAKRRDNLDDASAAGWCARNFARECWPGIAGGGTGGGGARAGGVASRTDGWSANFTRSGDGGSRRDAGGADFTGKRSAAHVGGRIGKQTDRSAFRDFRAHREISCGVYFWQIGSVFARGSRGDWHAAGADPAVGVSTAAAHCGDFLHSRGNDKFRVYAHIGADDSRDTRAGGEAVQGGGRLAEGGRRLLQKVGHRQLAGAGHAFAAGKSLSNRVAGLRSARRERLQNARRTRAIAP